MDQMQTHYMYLLQAMTAPRTEARQEIKSEAPRDNSFRKMMEERSEQTTEKPEQQPVEKESSQETADVQKDNPEIDDLDSAPLQELAAMQMLYVDTAQIIVMEEAAPAAEQQIALLGSGSVAAVGEQLARAGEMSGMQAQYAEQPEQADQAISADGQEAVNVTGTVTAAEENAGTQDHGGEADLQRGDQKLPAELNRVERSSVETADGQEETVEEQVFGEVDSAPVKVSDAAKPTELGKAETAELGEAESVDTQIVEKLTEALRGGETKVELQLTPEHLGKVTIELTQKADGSLHVALHAESSQTRALLERDLSGLQQLLSRGTQQEVQIDVPQPQENQQKNFQDGHQQQNQHQQQEQRQQRQGGEDFLNQLRLGLVPMDEEIL